MRKGTGVKGSIGICVLCHKEFIQPEGHAHKVCSEVCARIQRGLSGRRQVKRICPTCSKEFETEACWVKRGSGVYCSHECRWKNKFVYDKKQKTKAVNRVRVAIKNGNLIRRPCEICGEKEVEAHHYKGYADEHIYDVLWLCAAHHNQEHEKLRRTGQVSLL